MKPDVPNIRLNLVIYLYLSRLISKLCHIKRVAGYLFCTGRIGMHIIVSSIICHVRWYQIFPDITLHLVSYLYLLIINLSFYFKIVANKTSTCIANQHQKQWKENPKTIRSYCDWEEIQTPDRIRFLESEWWVALSLTLVHIT